MEIAINHERRWQEENFFFIVWDKLLSICENQFWVFSLEVLLTWQSIKQEREIEWEVNCDDGKRSNFIFKISFSVSRPYLLLLWNKKEMLWTTKKMKKNFLCKFLLGKWSWNSAISVTLKQHKIRQNFLSVRLWIKFFPPVLFCFFHSDCFLVMHFNAAYSRDKVLIWIQVVVFSLMKIKHSKLDDISSPQSVYVIWNS